MSRGSPVGDIGLALLLVGGGLGAVGLAGDLADHVTTVGDGADHGSGWLLLLTIGIVVSAIAAVGGLMFREPGDRRVVSPAIIGTILAAAGLVAHRLMQIEVEDAPQVMALVSPAHIAIVAGMTLVLLTPIAAVWARPVTRPGVVGTLMVWTPAILLLITVNLLTGHSSALIGGISFDIGWTEPVAGESLTETEVVRSLAQIIWFSVTVALTHAVLLRRFRPFPGVSLLGFVAMAAVPALLGGLEETRALGAGLLVAGMVVEGAVALNARPVLGPATAAVTNAAAVAALWATVFLVLDLDGRLAWPTSLCVGALATAAFLAAGASALVGVTPSAREPVPEPSPGALIGSPDRPSQRPARSTSETTAPDRVPTAGPSTATRPQRGVRVATEPSSESDQPPSSGAAGKRRRSIEELLEEYDDDQLFT